MSNQPLYFEAPSPFNEGLLRQQGKVYGVSQSSTSKAHSQALNYSTNTNQYLEQAGFSTDNERLLTEIPVSTGFVPAPQMAMGEIVTLPRPEHNAGSTNMNTNMPPENHQHEMYYEFNQNVPFANNPNPYEGNHNTNMYNNNYQNEMYYGSNQNYEGNPYVDQNQMLYDQQYQMEEHQQPPPLPPREPRYPEQQSANIQPIISKKKSIKQNHATIGDDFSDDNRSNQRCMYLCIPVKRRSRYVCFGITAVILIALAIVIAIFYPRLPTMNVLSINPAGNNSYQLTNFDKANPNNFKFTMNMVMVISVINTNMYHLKVDGIDLATYVNANGTAINNANPSPAQALFGIQDQRVYVTNDNYKNQIGSGTYGTIIFPPKINVTFTMNLNINYSPGRLGALNDPTLNEMIQLCVEGDTNVDSGRRTTISYVAVNSVGLLKYIGYNPTMRNTIKIRCPFQGSARTAFINAISGKGVTTP